MQGLPAFQDPDLLVGADHFSDAGVYRVAEDTAIVQSLDFFPPLVDDPYVFGQIAAANAMSDVYAMGARVVTAMNIVGFPDNEVDLEILQRILAGGAERVQAGGGVIVGGHSVRDSEIKYGLAVTGLAHPDRLVSNAAAAPGDVLVLTKPLGTGFITTANRADKCPADVLAAACDCMVQLNQAAAMAALELGVRAATDITGFGLAGHAWELAEASDVTLVLELDRLPLLPGAAELAAAGFHTRANATNRDHTASSTRLDAAPDDPRLEFLYDPQTSGGLLLAAPAAIAPDLVAACHAAGVTSATIIGRIIAPEPSTRLILGSDGA